jgi:hypothetical protein
MTIFVAMAMLAAAGCQTCPYEQGGSVGQGLTATYTAPAQPTTVIVTHADGTVTGGAVTDLAKQSTASPAVSVTVIPGTPGSSSSYVITPQRETGDKMAPSRVMTWAGNSPGEAVRDVATAKHKSIQNPLPAVALDATGVHAQAGGGSSDDAVGLPWHTRAWNAVTSFFRGATMWIWVLGIGLLLMFVLPIFIPALAPITAAIWKSIRTFLGWIWDVIERIIAWVEAKARKPAPAVPPPPAAPAAPTPSQPTPQA